MIIKFPQQEEVPDDLIDSIVDEITDITNRLLELDKTVNKRIDSIEEILRENGDDIIAKIREVLNARSDHH